jgi:hypothetical protein
MKKSMLPVLGMFGFVLAAGALAGSNVGCARPGELFYTPALTAQERYNEIARNWDNEGKMTQDDIDSILLLRPESTLTPWNLR